MDGVSPVFALLIAPVIPLAPPFPSQNADSVVVMWSVTRNDPLKYTNLQYFYHSFMPSSENFRIYFIDDRRRRSSSDAQS